MRNVVILLVEGRRAGPDSLAEALQKTGCRVCVAHTGSATFQWIGENGHPDLIVFDASTLRTSGVRICRRLRRILDNTPILHSRAENAPHDDSLQADVYLKRPFTSRKLLNRLRILLPADKSKEQIIYCGRLTLYPDKRTVEVDGQGEFSLTPKLAQLLEEFMRHPEQLVTRRQLMQNVWQTDYVGDTRTLDVHIRWVREYIETDPGNPKLLQTVRGQGYIFHPSHLERE
jgi:DNA-binding response OmpR family regulator